MREQSSASSLLKTAEPTSPAWPATKTRASGFISIMTSPS